MRTTDLVNIIFGMKVRQARLEAGMSLTQFAAKCRLSASYVTEIEKGRKRPQPDKIMRLAEALDKDYDDLVSIKLGPSLAYLEDLISSPLVRQFPFAEFEVEVGDLLNMLTRAPDKVSALLHAVLDIARMYDIGEEHFLRAALRSYQEIHENYFQEIEDAAVEFSLTHKLNDAVPLSLARLREIITQVLGYSLDEIQLASNPLLATYRSVIIPGKAPKVLLNSTLQENQLKFVLARELGYHHLGITERANTSPPDKVDSFDQVLNDFKASYFAGALMMPQKAILADLEAFFKRKTWQDRLLLKMLSKYDVTPEMLLYRFSELIPEFFGLKLHFLRFHSAGGDYQLVKQLNMNNLLLPHGLSLHESHCRRWLSIQLLKEMQANPPVEDDSPPLVGAQISTFYDSDDRFLCLGFARPLALAPEVGSSVIIGFRMEPGIEQTIAFAQDPNLPQVIINQTCQRCPLLEDQCAVRSAPPAVLAQEDELAQRKTALSKLLAQLQG